MPDSELEPDLVLLIFLPPLLYSASVLHLACATCARTSRPIRMLAIGLVLATVLAVARRRPRGDRRHVVAGGVRARRDRLPHRPRRRHGDRRPLGVPRRVVTVVEGESLINDATAIVAYRSRSSRAHRAAFTAWKAGAEFLYAGIGGVAIGLAVGWVIAQVRERLNDPPVEITISLFSGYAAYLPAEELGLSGVIAAVTVGLYMGSQTVAPDQRRRSACRAYAVWQILTFLLNSFLFVLIGLQLPGDARRAARRRLRHLDRARLRRRWSARR